MLRLICAAALCALSLQAYAASASAESGFSASVRDLDPNDGIAAAAWIAEFPGFPVTYQLFFDDSRGSTTYYLMQLDGLVTPHAQTSHPSAYYIYRENRMWNDGVIIMATPHTELTITSFATLSVSVDLLGETATASTDAGSLSLKVIGSKVETLEVTSVHLNGDQEQGYGLSPFASAIVTFEEPLVQPPSPVPEPAAYLLMAAGLAAIAARSRAPHRAQRQARIA